MEVLGEYTFAAAPEAVFDTLTDPSALRRALPGCEEFREVSPEHYRVSLAVSLVISSVTVTGDVAITERERPSGYRIEVSGSGSAGSLHVDGRFRLEANGAKTLLRYQLAIEFTGALAVLGATIVEPAARLILGQFMGAMEKELVRT